MQQDFRGNVGQVVNGSVINHAPAMHLPTDPEVSRNCPQCRKKTWRYTQYCMHCHLDLSAFDQQMALARRNQTLKRRVGVLTAAGLGLVAISSVLSPWPGHQTATFMLGIGCLVMAGKILEGIRE